MIQPQPPMTGAPANLTIPTPLPPQIQPGPVSASAFARVTWQGDVPPQKWMNFYTKVLSKFATQAGLRIGLRVEIAPANGISSQRLDEIKVALRELALPDDVSTEG
jgi:hypothetical protein